jgi:hypothetical protein
VGPVTVDRTHQVMKKAPKELTGNDLTLRWRKSGQYSDASDHGLVKAWVSASGSQVAVSGRCRARPIVTKALAQANLTIGIGRSSLKAGDMWMMIGDRTLGLVGLVTLTSAFGRPKFSAGRGANGSIRWGSLYKCVGRLLLTLLAIFIDITT